MNYVKSYRNPQRFETRKVKIGTCEFGGDNPIRVQSMTTENTMDTEASVEQSIRMIEAGCELVRITAPSKKDAENLKELSEKAIIKAHDELKKLSPEKLVEERMNKYANMGEYKD